MENSSKALVMAGSILIALAIISSLIYMFNYVTSYQKTAEDSTRDEQMANVDKEFLSYEKSLYGSELLSLINKVIDYNIKYPISDGYEPIKIVFYVGRGTGDDNRSSLVQSGQTYTIFDKTSNKVSEKLLIEIENIKTNYGGEKNLQRLVSLNDSGKIGEIDSLLQEINTSYNYSRCKDDIKKYAEYLEFKRKKFRFKINQQGTIYNNKTGRIEEMRYEEITS